MRPSLDYGIDSLWQRGIKPIKSVISCVRGTRRLSPTAVAVRAIDLGEGTFG